MELKRVVVTGLGALTPIGNTVSEYWNGLVSGKSGANNITYFDASNFKTQFACELKGFNAEDFMDRKLARKMDRFAQYAIVSSEEAIADSRLIEDDVDKDRVGVIWGAGIGGLETFQNEVLGFAAGNGTPRFNPFMIPKMIPDIAPGIISIRNGFRGPNFATVSACASSANALIDGLNYIRLGHADVIVSGGYEAGVSISGIGGFNALHALSTRNDSPETASRPFDKDRDGFVLGEGGGCLILEEYEHAKKRGAKIYAELVGYAATSDGHDMVAPSGEGAERAMVEAMSTIDGKIDYINAHGTSTPAGDPPEINAIKRAFGDSVPRISSTKSLSGHSLGAAGAHEAIYSLLMLENDFICASANVDNLDPLLEGAPIVTERIDDAGLQTVMSNSFGFGGTNAVLAFQKHSD